MALGKKTGGRRPGTPNKATADIKAAAALHGAAALAALVSIAKGKNQPAAARVSAAVALLDRGFGKPAQSMSLTGAGGGPVQHQRVPSDLSGLTDAELDALERIAAKLEGGSAGASAA